MKIKRKWGGDKSISACWDKEASLAKHRINLIWTDEEYYPCDPYGVRIPNGFFSIIDKFHNTDRKKVFIFGGSTTFGWYLSYREALPHQLELLNPDICVFNCGVCGSDITQSMYLLQDMLRIGLIPDHALFLDGINEKQGYMQAVRGASQYEYRSNSFDLIEERFRSSKESLTAALYRQLIRRASSFKQSSELNLLRFVEQQSKTYRLSRSFVSQLGKCYGFATDFMLQPVVWDVLPTSYGLDREEHNRWSYLKALYADIIKNENNNVIDLCPVSKNILTPEMFIDWQHVDDVGNRALALIISQQFRSF